MLAKCDHPQYHLGHLRLVGKKVERRRMSKEEQAKFTWRNGVRVHKR